jgi:hypothetical protein
MKNHTDIIKVCVLDSFYVIVPMFVLVSKLLLWRECASFRLQYFFVALEVAVLLSRGFNTYPLP